MGDPFTATAAATTSTAGTATATTATAATAGATAGTAAAAGVTTAAAAGTAGLFTSAAGTFSLMQTLSTVGNIANIVSGISTIGGLRAKTAALKGQAKQFELQGRASQVQALQDAISIREQTLQRLASARAGDVGSRGQAEEILRFGEENVDRTMTSGLLRTLQSKEQASQLRGAASATGLAEFARGASLIGKGSSNIAGDIK